MSLMADDLVVIGKGKLITSGSVDEITSSAKGTGVFVRADSLVKLEKALKKKFSVIKQGDGLDVRGAKTDDIGRAAFEAGIPILELANKSASLEEAFLEITATSQEYKTGDKK